MEITRGDIYFIDNRCCTGSEQEGARPAIIVSNNYGNHFSNTLEVVFLTTRYKKPLPTHVPILSAERISTALCESITTVDKSRLIRFVSHCSEIEMQRVNEAIKISLDL